MPLDQVLLGQVKTLLGNQVGLSRPQATPIGTSGVTLDRVPFGQVVQGQVKTFYSLYDLLRWYVEVPGWSQGFKWGNLG